jgi:transposase-like protein
VAQIPLHTPKLRQGSYLPSLLEPRKRSEKALLAVVQEAYVKGVSTRQVDDLVRALGLKGISKSKVSRICQGLDELVTAFRQRPLEGDYPTVWLDALYVKVRQHHRIVSQAVVIAIGVRRDGERTVLGLDVGPGEEEAFWTTFLRQLKERGLAGVQLVTSDAHNGLKKAIQAVLTGATWQRCRVHFMRNLLARISQRGKGMVAAAVRIIFAQPDRPAAGEQLEAVADALQPHWPAASELLRNAATDVPGFMAFPESDWWRIYSTNVLERLNKEVKRRTRVVEIFPNHDAVIRLVGALLVEADEEWQVQRRYFSQESMRELYEPDLTQRTGANVRGVGARALEEILLSRRSTPNVTT